MRVITLVLGIVSLILIVSSIALGQTVILSISPSSAPVGAEVSIPVNISDTTGREIISVDMTIQYDTRALEIIEDEDPSTPEIDGVIEKSGTMTASGWTGLVAKTDPGRVRVLLIGYPALSGSGVLVKIRFQVQLTARVGSIYSVGFTEAVLTIPSLFLLLVMAKFFGGKIPDLKLLGRTFAGVSS